MEDADKVGLAGQCRETGKHMSITEECSARALVMSLAATMIAGDRFERSFRALPDGGRRMVVCSHQRGSLRRNDVRGGST